MKSMKTLAHVGLAAGLVSVGALAAHANPAASYAEQFERPYGFGYNEESQPFDARTRDLNGNRVIVNGRMMVGDDLSTLPDGMWNLNGYSNGAGAGYGGSAAIGNQLNVITQGSWNTVIIDSTQINSGDINAGYLNGELNLHD